MDIMIDDVNYKCKISHQLEQQLLKSTTVDTADIHVSHNNPAPYLNPDFFSPQRTFFDGTSIGRQPPVLPPPIPFQSMQLPRPVNIPRYGSFSDPAAAVSNLYGRSPQFLSSRSADSNDYNNFHPHPVPQNSGLGARNAYPPTTHHQFPQTFHNRYPVSQSSNSSNNSIIPTSVNSLLDGVKDISLNSVSVDSTIGSYSSLPLTSSRTNTPPPLSGRNNLNNCSSNSFALSFYSQATTSASDSSFTTDNATIARTLSAAGRSSVSPAPTPAVSLPVVHLIHNFPDEEKSLYY
jgi:hypothetical protein